MKKYLRLGDPIVTPTEDRFVGPLQSTIEWVDGLEDATPLERESAEAAQEQLAGEQKLETKLIEIQDTQRLESRWVVYRKL
jgi:hypothetical protein